MHEFESLVAYDGGSSVMLWEVLDDIKLRVHEHNNPIRLVKFFGESQRFIFSCDYRTILISEWHSLKRVAELNIPLKKSDTPVGDMMMDYRMNSMILLTRLSTGYRITILSFKEFSLKFVFAADMNECGPAILSQFFMLEKLCNFTNLIFRRAGC